MSFCINPRCIQPDHPGNSNNHFCQSCGSELILKGRYRVLRLLSDQSGFGRVYEAYERSYPKILKVLKAEHNQNAKAVELFQREAVVLSQLQHTGVPQMEPEGYFQFVPKEGLEPLHCIIMEKIDGLNLRQWMLQQGSNPISIKQALNWLQQLAEILHLIHQKNYFHRDIKPENIMLRPNGRLVLVDFGTAREITSSYLAQIGDGGNATTLGSLGYTPPEQEQGQALPQSDFYALGRTFIYLLTGKQPIGGGIHDSFNTPLKWSDRAPNLPPQLVNFINQLTAPQAANRPRNTQEILDQLAQLNQALSQAQFQPRASNSLPTAPLETPTTLPTALQRENSPQKKWLWGGIGAVIIALGGYAGWQIYQHSRSPVMVREEAISIDKILPGHSSFVNVVMISSDGQTLFSGGADKTIRIWDLATGGEIRALEGHSSAINDLILSPDGQTLISGGADKTIRIWDVATGEERLMLSEHLSPINALVISPDGQTLISGSADALIRIWDLSTGKGIRTFSGHTSAINTLVISPDGQTLISGSADKTIKTWDLNSGREIRTFEGHNSAINAIVVTPNGQVIISGSADATIKLWNLTMGQEIHTFTEHSNYVNDLAISPDGTTLVSSSADETIKLWDLAKGQVSRTLTGYGTHIDQFAISPDWEIIATGSGGKVIKVWQLRRP
ncbi:MAG: protein kinase [Cyanothece sp. SIO1E1]|nr:protein kinase [Cyanothece sp. SIO1E1]